MPFLCLVKLHLGSEVYIIQVCLSMPFVFFMLVKLNLGSELGYAGSEHVANSNVANSTSSETG